MFKTISSIIFLLGFPTLSFGTSYFSIPLSEIVDLASHIGIVKIQKAEVYEIPDSKEPIMCGIIYDAKWVDSFTSNTGPVEFVSAQNLDINAQYLVYLAKNIPPPHLALRILSVSKEQGFELESQIKACKRNAPQLSTLQLTSSKILNENHVAKVFKTRKWVEYRQFFYDEFKTIVVYPEAYNIDGDVIPRERFLKEFYDESKHQVIRTAGWDLIIFKAVDWYEYRTRLEELVAKKHNQYLESE